jgi:GNAT superfamily N-acetyltransferase
MNIASRLRRRIPVVPVDTNRSPVSHIVIVRATSADAPALTTIAFAAKRHWGYPEPWIESWRELLTIRPDLIASHDTYVALDGDRKLGFYVLAHKGDRLDLLHLWVWPEAMGRGVGRSLFLHATQRTKELGYSALEIESDPNAEGFYLRMGARRVGSSIREAEHGRRELPTLIYEIHGDEDPPR